MGWTLKGVYRAVLRRRNIVVFPSDNKNATEIHNFFINMALQQAQKAKNMDEVPIGAIVVRPCQTPTTTNNNTFEILARAFNRVERNCDASAHAELLAMRQASRRVNNWRLLNSTLYSTLEPCPMCLAASQGFRISSIVYGAPDLRLGAVETHMRLLDVPHPFHNITNVVKDVQANQSVELLQDFFRKRRQAAKSIKKCKESQ